MNFFDKLRMIFATETTLQKALAFEIKANLPKGQLQIRVKDGGWLNTDKALIPGFYRTVRFVNGLPTISETHEVI